MHKLTKQGEVNLRWNIKRTESLFEDSLWAQLWIEPQKNLVWNRVHAQ